MHEFDFTTLRQALLDWPSRVLPEPDATRSPLLGRLRQILEAARSSGFIASHPDLMVLIRQLLISRSKEGLIETLTVPQNQGWPNAADWETYGFRLTKTGTRFLLEAKPWRPDWLGTATDQPGDLFEQEHQANMVRCDAQLPIDPFLGEVTGFEHYVSPGQKEAILSALLMPAGTSLIVNLPTGSGKSLVAQAPMLVHGLDAGLTLFIVPTNALALDLERRTRELVKARDPTRETHPLAWIGSRCDGSREAIKQRIRSANQGILFASPEAVCGSLLYSLYAAAELGLITYLVIDEAHLIAQWGDDFRPAFQQLSGVRRGLLEACPGEGFRTLLLSATFSPQVVKTLEFLFGPKDGLQAVSAVHLRPEPRYLSYRATSPNDKMARVDELLRHVPRPFILYATKRQDAKEWYNRLRQAGYRRIACVHGETPNDMRERVIEDWVEDRLDGVVATSAFGVGMDKSDVRTVIHAALPETLDRFYQEVGRGGRDGQASLSICLFDDDDIGVARGLSAPTLIGDDKGFERWSTLYREAQQDPVDPDVRLVDLRMRPVHQTQENDRNRDWNMRTLILLARAGLIRLESTRPRRAERADGEDEASFEARTEVEQEAYFAQISVRTLDPRLMDRAHFERQVGGERKRGKEAANRAFEHMLSALNGEREMADVLVELFASESVVVSPACRGCPASGGAQHIDGGLYQIPPGIGISRLVPYDKNAWQKRFGHLDPSMVVVLCPGVEQDKALFEALRAAVASFGIRELALQPTLRETQPLLSELHHSAPDRILVFRDLSDTPGAPDTLPLARATILLPWGDRPFPEGLLLLERPLHLVFAPEYIRDVSHPLRQYRDTATNCIALQEFLRRATQ
jgi:superfamily II DNA/RNA helicase